MVSIPSASSCMRHGDGLSKASRRASGFRGSVPPSGRGSRRISGKTSHVSTSHVPGSGGRWPRHGLRAGLRAVQRQQCTRHGDSARCQPRNGSEAQVRRPSHPAQPHHAAPCGQARREQRLIPKGQPYLRPSLVGGGVTLPGLGGKVPPRPRAPPRPGAMRPGAAFAGARCRRTAPGSRASGQPAYAPGPCHAARAWHAVFRRAANAPYDAGVTTHATP